MLALFTAQFLQIARELDGLDPYQYTKAFSAGLQEFIEAYTYYKYLIGENISDWDDLQKMLYYEKSTDNVDAKQDDDDKSNEENSNKNEVESLINQSSGDDNAQQISVVETNDDDSVQAINKVLDIIAINEKPLKTYKCLVQPIEFMLGIGDLSGEVMRHCINALNSGDLDECFQARKFMQFLYTG